MQINKTQELSPSLAMTLQGFHIIEASAGTGKTWSLIALVVRLIVEKGLSCEQIVATTFTKNAAHEIKERLHSDLQKTLDAVEHNTLQSTDGKNMLFDHLHNLQQDPAAGVRPDKMHKRIKQALLNLEQMRVLTLDAFFAQLLQEHALAIGYSQLSLQTDISDYVLELVHDYLRAFYLQHAELVYKVVKVEEVFKGISPLLNYPNISVPVIDLPLCLDKLALSNLQQQVQQTNFAPLLSHLGAHLQGVNGIKVKHKETLIARLNTFITQFIACKHLSEIPSGKFNWLLKNPIDIFKNGYEAAKEALLQMPQLALLVQMAKLVENAQADTNQYIYSGAYHYVNTHLPTYLQRQGFTSFNQITASLLDALKRNSALCAHIRSQHPAILVDEFQDASSIQAEIIATIYPQALCQNDFVCTVGDPKQAIYGFRGGDVNAYLRYRSTIPSSNVHPLTYCFRSSPALVACFDAFFKLKPHFGEQINYLPTQVAALAPKPELLWRGKPLDSAWLYYDNAEHSAQGAVEKIQQLLQLSANKALTLGGKTIVPADIAVLVSTNAHVAEVVKYLSEQQIATQQNDYGNVFNHEAALAMLAFVKLCESPQRGQFANTLLRSPWCPINHNGDAARLQLQQIAMLYEAEPRAHHSRLLQAWAAFAEHFTWQQSIAQYFGAYSTPQLCQVWVQATLQLLGLCHLYQLSHPEAILSTWLQGQITAPLHHDEQRLIVHSDHTDGVYVSTYHQAKGLQFPIVWVLNGFKGSTNTAKFTLFQQQHQLHAHFSKLASAEANKLGAERQQAEKVRQLYVALTRAEALTIVDSKSNYGKANGKSPTPLGHWLGEGEQIEENLSQLPHCMRWPFDGAEKQSNSVTVATSLTPAYNATPVPNCILHSWRIGSFSQLTRHSTTSTALQDADIQPVRPIDGEHSETASNENAEPIAANPVVLCKAAVGFARGALAGTCMHSVMERLEPHNQARWDGIISEQLTAYGIPLDAKGLSIADMRQWVDTIWQAPLLGAPSFALADIDPASKAHELNFYMATQLSGTVWAKIVALFAAQGISIPSTAQSAHINCLNGAIDLVFAIHGKYYILDYKTNFLAHYDQQHMQQEMDKHHYYLQAAIYMVALHRLLRQRLANYCLSEHLGGAIYSFVRGANNQGQAHSLHWLPTATFITELDALLLHAVQLDSLLQNAAPATP